MKETPLAKLAEIAAMLRDAELSRLNHLERTRTRLEEQRQKIHKDRIAAMASLSLDPARMTGADVRWQGWASQQVQGLTVRAAQQAAAVEHQKIQARRAFGRADVLQRLACQKKPDRNL